MPSGSGDVRRSARWSMGKRMQPLRVYSVVPKLPAKLKPLWELAYNLLFSWNDDIVTLFAQVDRKLWRECYGNPVGFLNRLPQKVLESLAEDDFFVERVGDLYQELQTYLARKTASIPFPDQTGSPLVAYFSLEYGITQCLPIYSGGLGILAGDHLKSASDLCVPLVGIGLCYQQGFFPPIPDAGRLAAGTLPPSTTSSRCR